MIACSNGPIKNSGSCKTFFVHYIPLHVLTIHTVLLFTTQKMGLTGVAMETMRPSGPVKLENIERGMYKEVSQHHLTCTSNSILHLVS